MKMADSATLQLVLFRVSDMVCALPAGIVREVLPSLPITRIPGVPSAVEGLVNVRGALLTLIDAHVLLGRPRDRNTDHEVVTVECSGRQWGLAVGAVLDFVELAEADLKPWEGHRDLDPQVARASGWYAEQEFVLLNIDALLAPLIGSSSL